MKSKRLRSEDVFNLERLIKVLETPFEEVCRMFDEEEMSLWISPEGGSSALSSFSQTKCKVPAIVVTPHQKLYNNPDEHNFCYTRELTGLKWTLEGVEIAASVASVVFTGPFAAAVVPFVVDCGIAAFEIFVGDEKGWPKGPSGTKRPNIL